MDSSIASPPRRGRRWPYLLLLLIAGFVGYVALTLWWSYSEGERVGIVQKLSRKGWVCKTYEGELALYVVSGMAPQIWEFTVRDQQVANRLNAVLGERVRLHYSEHRGLPTNCFGDTRYFVDSVDAGVTLPVLPGSPAPANAPAGAPSAAAPVTAPAAAPAVPAVPAVQATSTPP